VQSEAHARQLVDKVRYPRLSSFEGVRGQRGSATSVRAHGYGAFGGQAATAHANEHVVLMLMLESVEAIDQAAAIAAVPGVDGVFIGPNDLAHSMGYENQFYSAAVQAQIERAVRAIAGEGVCAGVLALTPEDEQRYASWGASYFAATITGVVTKALKDAAAAGRSAVTSQIGY
jgi:4-hydroxy-2-oxoheptanedioate aldolase